jgi:hypothetical protein
MITVADLPRAHGKRAAALTYSRFVPILIMVRSKGHALTCTIAGQGRVQAPALRSNNRGE